MGERYLIDTNIAIYFLDGHIPTNAIAFLIKVLNNESNISIISKIELLGWNFPNSEKMEINQDFVDSSTAFPLDNEVVEKTIDLRRKHKIKLPDAIIAATAIIFDFTLISRNDKDFENI
jgi:predicted nucleic acid-binding protein